MKASSLASPPNEVSPPKQWLTHGVLGIGLASLFSDWGHEAATAILPAFLASLGAPAFALGVIEGVSDGLSSFAKLAGGWIADRPSWRKPTGFRADFCMRCGSPVPHPLRDLPYIWVPAGLLDAPGALEIVAHIFVDSKAPWDILPPGGARFPDAPSVGELMSLLDTDA